MGMLHKIISVGVGLLVAGTIVPLALVAIAASKTGSINMVGNGVNSSVITIFTVLLPILAIIGLALYFMPFGED
jgi:hypothetical protein